MEDAERFIIEVDVKYKNGKVWIVEDIAKKVFKFNNDSITDSCCGYDFNRVLHEKFSAVVPTASIDLSKLQLKFFDLIRKSGVTSVEGKVRIFTKTPICEWDFKKCMLDKG